MKTKTLILSNSNKYENARAIVTLSTENDLLMVKLRLYSHPELNRDVKIAVYHNEEVYSANLINRRGYYESSLVGDYDFDKDFYIALIDTQNNNNLLLSGSTYAGYFYNAPSVFEKNFPTEDETENLIDEQIELAGLMNDSAEDLSTNETNKSNEKEHIKNMNDCEEKSPVCKIQDDECEDKCEHCKYKEYFYANNSPVTPPDKIEPINTPKDSLNEGSLAQMVSQFDYVFENYPQNDELNSLIEGGKFVTIREGSDNYSIGAIYEHEQMKYICYAVKASYNSPAPQELGEFYQWLPTDKDDPLTDGYYIVFQDAKDLKIIEV